MNLTPEGTTNREWDEAYRRVEAYLSALRIRNKLLQSRLVQEILFKAAERAGSSGKRPPLAVSVDQIDDVLIGWFQQVLGDGEHAPDEISLRGRLALLLADLPSQWQDQFLRDPPWPEPFVEHMRKSFLRAGPDFVHSHMQDRPLELGAMTTVAERTFLTLERRPVLKASLLWVIIGALFFVLFYYTR